MIILLRDDSGRRGDWRNGIGTDDVFSILALVGLKEHGKKLECVSRSYLFSSSPILFMSSLTIKRLP